MSDTPSNPEADAIALLTQTAHRHEFVQLVRRIERMLVLDTDSDSAGEGRQRGLVGTDAMPAAEPLRFSAAASLGFAVSQVQGLRAPAGGALPLEMSVNFMGLIGPAGVLPRHYTATAIARARDKDESLNRFLDLFHSRLLGLFYRAFARYSAAASYEVRRRKPDLLTLLMRAMVGFSDSGSIPGLLGGNVFEHDILGFAGLYSNGRRSAKGLEQMLGAQLRLPVRIEQFAGQWLDVPADQRTRLPANRGVAGTHHTLGANAVLGKRVWDPASRLGVRIGPLTFNQYIQFIPGGAGLRRAGMLGRMYVRQEFDLLIRPVLAQRSVPRWRLASDRKRPHLLGRTVWLRSRGSRFTHDFDAAGYAPPD